MSEVDEVPRDLADPVDEPFGDEPAGDEATTGDDSTPGADTDGTVDEPAAMDVGQTTVADDPGAAPGDPASDGDPAPDTDEAGLDDPVPVDEFATEAAPEVPEVEIPLLTDEVAPEEDEAAREDEAAPEEDEALGFTMPTPMSQMAFVDVVMVLPSTHPVVVLQEAEFPYRELRIPIGGPEGIAIGYASRQVATPRPLTHELMSKLLESFGLTLEVVRITGFQGGMFTAEISVSGPTGQRVLDCRPSDAIALALRQPIHVPIMADPDVLDRAAGAAAGQN